MPNRSETAGHGRKAEPLEWRVLSVLDRLFRRMWSLGEGRNRYKTKHQDGGRSEPPTPTVTGEGRGMLFNV